MNRFEKKCDAAVVVVVRIRESRCRRLHGLRLGRLVGPVACWSSIHGWLIRFCWYQYWFCSVLTFLVLEVRISNEVWMDDDVIDLYGYGCVGLWLWELVIRFAFNGFVKNSWFVMIGMGWCTVLLLVCVVRELFRFMLWFWFCKLLKIVGFWYVKFCRWILASNLCVEIGPLNCVPQVHFIVTGLGFKRNWILLACGEGKMYLLLNW